MRVLGEATGVTSAHVFENVGADGPSTHTRRLAGWESGRSQLDRRRPAARPSPACAPLPTLGRGARPWRRRQQPHQRPARRASVKRSPLQARSRFSRCRSSSRVAWWGFIGFEDAEHERDWSPAETEALRAAAGIVAAAIKRELAERDLRRRDAVLEAVSHGARTARRRAELARRCTPLPARARRGVRCEPLVPVRERSPRRWPADRKPAVRVGCGDDRAQLDNPVMQDMCFEEVGLARFAELGTRNELFTEQGERPTCRRAEVLRGSRRSSR